MDLRRLDLNLLVVFDAVMREQSVTRAATKIFLTQSAVSNALNRLRDQIGDELFLRGPGKLRPTQRAIELAQPVHTILVELGRVLDPAEFDPATEQRTFTIATNDYFTSVIAPPLAARLAREAPFVNLRIVPTGGRGYEMLDASQIDLLCISTASPPARFGSHLIVEDDYVLMVRDSHPFARRAPTLRAFAGAKHLMVSPVGDASGFVDEVLAERGLRRRIAMVINHFAAAPQIIANTDFVLTVPRLLAERFKPKGVRILAAPFVAPAGLREMKIIWHERLSQHPAQHWMRRLCVEVGMQL